MIDLQALTKAVGELKEDELFRLLDELIESDPSQQEAQLVVAACQKGMSIIGDLFEKNEYFVGDLIYAGELLTDALDKLKPFLGQHSSEKIGTIVLGTVQGDLHDIGKNIFKSMAEAAGFEVYDIGVDQPSEAFIDEIKRVKPQIVGMSGVLTTALTSMEKIVEDFIEQGIRDDFKIIIGGNPVTFDTCKHIGADAFTVNAAEGAKICQEWVTNHE